MNRKETGYFGEKVAAKALTDRGYTLLRRNFTIRGGEIDLILEREGEIVFVEVKTRRNEAFGTALESITPAKRRRMIRAAEVFLGGGAADRDVRFFAVAVYLKDGDTVARTEIYEDIFS
ncbi:MAG: YraN family protein [Bacillota bacterium]|jgi:putative endonuclease